MKFSSEYRRAIEIAYPRIIESEKKESEEYKKLFYKNDFKKMSRINTKVEIALLLRSTHNELMFFGDEGLMHRLKILGLKYSCLRWFVSLDQIIEQFKIIEESNIVIDKPMVLTLFRTHLQFKFANDMLSWVTKNVKHDGVSMNILTKELFNLRNRREYSGGDPKRYKNVFEVLLNGLVNHVEAQTKGEFDINAFLEISKGRSEKTILKTIIEDCFDYDEEEISKNKFLSIVYDLFRIVMQDYNLENEDEFIDKKDILEPNFDIRKARRLKTLIYKV